MIVPMESLTRKGDRRVNSLEECNEWGMSVSGGKLSVTFVFPVIFLGQIQSKFKAIENTMCQKYLTFYQ